jgi:hypothetical protein
MQSVYLLSIGANGIVVSVNLKESIMVCPSGR